MFEPVFVTRDSNANFITVVPAHVGIVKVEGCYQFFCAIKDEDGEYGYNYDDNEKAIARSTCRRRYGSVPKKGEAYLVEEGRKHINWTRVDEEMYLLDREGNIVKED